MVLWEYGVRGDTGTGLGLLGLWTIRVTVLREYGITGDRGDTGLGLLGLWMLGEMVIGKYGNTVISRGYGQVNTGNIIFPK